LIARFTFPGRKKGGISSLQVVSSFACSVARLSLFQGIICQVITIYNVKFLQTTSLIEVSSPNVQ
jgi:hypothetical protein